MFRCMASENETLSLQDEKERLRQDMEQLNSALNELGRENQALQVEWQHAWFCRPVTYYNVLNAVILPIFLYNKMCLYDAELKNITVSR